MKKLSAIFIIPLMLLGAFLVPSIGHAQTGVVSVNGGSLVIGSASPSTVNVPIQISGSEVFSGFDVQVVTDQSVLQGASISLAGSILPSPSVLVECINGVLIAGTSCASQAGFGVVQLAAANTVGQFSASGTGLLFTITYNVVSDSGSSPITFNTGCLGTSVSGGDCVTIANGSPTAVPETDQGASFSNIVDFTMATQYAHYSTTPSTPAAITINYASEGGYQDFLTETASVSPAGASCSFASGTPDLLDFTTTSDVMTCSGSAGSYTVAVTAMGQGIDSPPQPILTHTINVPLLIGSPDFSVGLSQSSVTVARGGSDSTTNVDLTGFNTFSGTVTITASGPAGITASAPMATLTPDGSGYSSAAPVLTVNVANTVSTGSYSLTVTGTSGSLSHSAVLTVVVPGQGFILSAVPDNIIIARGGTLALDLNFVSLGNLNGPISLSAVISPVAGQQDSCCLTNNISPSFSPASSTLPAGGTLTVAFTATTVGGLAPSGPSYTATGNYTAVVTATIGAFQQSVPITFQIQDFTLGPAYCVGTSQFITTTSSSFTDGQGSLIPSPYGNIITNADGSMVAGQYVGSQCSSLTITAQPNVLSPYFGLGNQVLFVQTNALGGFQTNGFNGLPSVSIINQALPFNGIAVPQLAPVLSGNPDKACMVPTFWANGTQIPYSYLAANGPLILPSLGFYPWLSGLIGYLGVNWGCRFDNAAYPGDAGNNGYGNFTNYNNPDFWGVNAMALSGTLPGHYTFDICPTNAIVTHCLTYGLNVVANPSIHQLVVKSSYSYSGSGHKISFKVGLTNNDATYTLYMQVTANGVGSLGDTFSVTSATVSELPGASNANNIQFSIPLTSSMIGETFVVSFSIVVGTDPNNLDGTTVLSVTRTIHITA